MDNQDQTGQGTQKASTSASGSEGIKTVDPKTTGQAPAEHFAEIEKEMNSFERSTLRWARTAVIMSGLAAIFVCAQWVEMHESSGDTHTLAQQAITQGKDLHDLAIAAQNQAAASGQQATTDQQSFGMTKLLMEGNNEAICDFRIVNLDETKNIEHLIIENRGKVTAKHLIAHIEFVLLSLPESKPLSNLQRLEWKEDELPGSLTERAKNYSSRDIVIAALNEQHRRSINLTNETWVARGELQYDNGFGTTKHIPFCQAFIHMENYPGSSMPLNSTVECSDVSSFLERTRASANWLKAHPPPPPPQH